MFGKSSVAQYALSSHHASESKSDEILLSEIERDRKKVIDPELHLQFHGFWRHYLHLTFYSRHLCVPEGVYYNHFSSFVIFLIVIAGITIGIQTYPGMEENPILNGLDITISLIFALEYAIKIIAEGRYPLKYFYGEERMANNLDFFVVVICLPYITDFLLGKTAAIRIITKLFRLVRLSKLAQKIPALFVIIKGLIGGMKSICYIAILMVVVIYIYAVLGVYLFKENDPFFFRDVPIALLTLFHAMTLDSWGDNVLINVYGCDQYPAGIYVQRSDYTNQTLWDSIPDFYKCTHPSKQAALSGFYWVSFTAIASLVVLSLFVGIISINMQESMNEMRKEIDDSSRKAKMIQNVASLFEVTTKANALLMAQVVNNKNSSNTVVFRGKANKERADNVIASRIVTKQKSILGSLRWKMYSPERKATRKKSLSLKDGAKIRAMREMSLLLLQAWSKTKIPGNYYHIDDSLTIREQLFKKFIRGCAIRSNNILEHPQFNNAMTLVIIFAAIMVGIEMDYPAKTNSTEIIYLVIDNIIFALFTIEILLRMAAEEFNFLEYFKQAWNVVDFVVVVATQVPGTGTFVAVLRLFRILRVMKLVKALPGLAVIVNALLIGLASIGYIGIIIFLTFYLFAILGMILFKQNDPFRFGTLHTAMFTLFDVATLDDWGKVLYTEFYGCNVYPLQDPEFVGGECVKSKAGGLLAAFYFVVFIIVGAFVMLTLFVGVVSTSMEEASRQQLVSKEVENRIGEISSTLKITSHQIDLYRRVFAILDLDSGGTVDKDELRIGLGWMNIVPSTEEIDAWMKDLNVKSEGEFDLVEFISFMTMIQNQFGNASKEESTPIVMKAKRKLMDVVRKKRSEIRQEKIANQKITKSLVTKQQNLSTLTSNGSFAKIVPINLLAAQMEVGQVGPTLIHNDPARSAIISFEEGMATMDKNIVGVQLAHDLDYSSPSTTTDPTPAPLLEENSSITLLDSFKGISS